MSKRLHVKLSQMCGCLKFCILESILSVCKINKCVLSSVGNGCCYLNTHSTKWNNPFWCYIVSCHPFENNKTFLDFDLVVLLRASHFCKKRDSK